MIFCGSIFLAVGAGVASAITTRSFGPRAPSPPPLHADRIQLGMDLRDSNGNVLPPLNTTYYFDQLIDHNDANKGTFKQRYWMAWDFYKDGGPIVLSTPGENNAEGFGIYITNRSIPGQIAQQQGGATINLEHRFFGLSNPIDDLSVQSLQLLTVQQSIDDLEYFVKNVQVPAPINEPSKAPWVLVGGSYAGALTAWTMETKPNLFAAGWASSAPVETIVDFWQYYEPVRTNMPQNCSNDIQTVVAHFDAVANDPQAIAALKAQFGMEAVEHYDDVTSALRDPLSQWQDLQPYTEPGTAAPFFQFCDGLEVINRYSAPPSGWGLENVLSSWGAYFKNEYLPSTCGNDNYNDCLGTYNANQEQYTSTEVDNPTRSWQWLVCNELGWFQEAAPVGYPTIVSRTLQPANRDIRICGNFFPGAQPVSSDRINKTDLTYKGTDINVQTVFFAAGTRDPWLYATVAAPGITPANIPQSHIGVHNASHTNDLLLENAVDLTVDEVQKKGFAFIQQTLADCKSSSGGCTSAAQLNGSAVPVNSKSSAQHTSWTPVSLSLSLMVLWAFC